jgi:preprotein translocase subunit YajC
MLWHILLAQGDAGAGAGGQPQGPPPLMQFLPIIAIFAIMYFLMILPMRRQKREQMNMLAALKKNDKVITSSGILGTVVALKEQEDEVTLKVDDTSNTRIRMLKSSIVRVIPSESAEVVGETKSS